MVYGLTLSEDLESNVCMTAASRNRLPTKDEPQLTDPILFGHSPEEGLVAVEFSEGSSRSAEAGDSMVLFVRRGDKTERTTDELNPFLIVSSSGLRGRKLSLADCPVEMRQDELAGAGELDTKVSFNTWRDCVKAKSWLANVTGVGAAVPDQQRQDPFQGDGV